MNAGIFVGLDVGQSGVHAAARPAGRWSAAADDAGIFEIANTLSSLQPQIVVLEAQGGVELPVAGALATSGLPLAFVSRRNVKEFARSVGQRGDRSHAELLAHFAELVRPDVQPVPSSVVDLLQALKAREREMCSLLELERNRVKTEIPAVQRSVRSHIYFLERSVTSLSEEMNQAVRSSAIWR